MTDKHEGKGGSYIVDKKTGERVLVERTADPQQEAGQIVDQVEKKPERDYSKDVNKTTPAA